MNRVLVKKCKVIHFPAKNNYIARPNIILSLLPES